MDTIFSKLYGYTNQIIQLNAGEKQLLESAFTYREVPRKHVLCPEGKISRELYFVNKGLIRLYYTKDGADITGYIFREGLFASSYDSFLRQVPGIQTLETLEDCELLVISYTDLEKLYDTLPKMQVLARKVADQRFINAQLILSSYILDSPEERYIKFEQQHGDLLLRVPHHMIASYLGIAPASLSRIRRRLMP